MHRRRILAIGIQALGGPGITGPAPSCTVEIGTASSDDTYTYVEPGNTVVLAPGGAYTLYTPSEPSRPQPTRIPPTSNAAMTRSGKLKLQPLCVTYWNARSNQRAREALARLRGGILAIVVSTGGPVITRPRRCFVGIFTASGEDLYTYEYPSSTRVALPPGGAYILRRGVTNMPVDVPENVVMTHSAKLRLQPRCVNYWNARSNEKTRKAVARRRPGILAIVVSDENCYVEIVTASSDDLYNYIALPAGGAYKLQKPPPILGPNNAVMTRTGKLKLR
jgi:hypothetical protein